MREQERLFRDWSIDWGVMDVLIGGKSAIDLTELPISDMEDATQFLRYYGYDPEKPAEALHIHSVIVEALHFLSHYLMPEEWEKGIKPPDDLLFADDARVILLAAADTQPSNKMRQAWACCLLRIMHTIAHIEGVTRLLDIDVARDQIMGRFREFVFQDEAGLLQFGKPGQAVELSHVEWKHNKSRPSIVLKLLHKRANVAENIYDYLGVRLVTKKLCDVVKVAKFLGDFHMVSFPNCNPGRARNSLIDVAAFRRQLRTSLKNLQDGRITVEKFEEEVEEAAVYVNKEEDFDPVNPHSGREYRAVQLTGRQLIRIPYPLHQMRQKWLKLRENNPEGLPQKILDEALFISRNWQYHEEGLEYIGFFPFEVHILDERTAIANRQGEANHNRYKRSQFVEARRRVLGRVFGLYGLDLEDSGT